MVSVIVPVYNVEKYLDRCVESIVKQTYKDLEIWLVDDGSPDKCPQMCDEWEKKDSRINVIHKKNGGLSDARNAALDVMTGEYVTFVDSDDYLESDAVEAMYDALVRNNAQIAVGNMKFFTDDNKIGYQFSPCYEEKLLIGDGKLELINQPSAHNKLYISSIFSSLRYPFGKYYEDLYIWHIILQNVDKIVMTGKTAYYYFIRNGSIMQSKYSIKSTHRFEPHRDRADWLDSIGRNDLATDNRLFIYADFADACANMDVFNGENKNRFYEIKSIYCDVYKKLMTDDTVGFKQKVRLLLLRYFPLLHTELFR